MLGHKDGTLLYHNGSTCFNGLHAAINYQLAAAFGNFVNGFYDADTASPESLKSHLSSIGLTSLDALCKHLSEAWSIDKAVLQTQLQTAWPPESLQQLCEALATTQPTATPSELRTHLASIRASLGDHQIDTLTTFSEALTEEHLGSLRKKATWQNRGTLEPALHKFVTTHLATPLNLDTDSLLALSLTRIESWVDAANTSWSSSESSSRAGTPTPVHAATSGSGAGTAAEEHAREEP